MLFSRASDCWIKCNFSVYLVQCTKQMFSERFGRGSRTVDLELEAQIDRSVKRHKVEVREHLKTSHGAHHSLPEHGADAAGFGRHLHRPQPEVPRVAGFFFPFESYG